MHENTGFVNSHYDKCKNIDALKTRISKEAVEEQWVLNRKTNKSRYAVKNRRSEYINTPTPAE